MTSTGYKAMVFTEINPTSTTSTIFVVYTGPYNYKTKWTAGPFVLIPHDAGAPLPTTPTYASGTVGGLPPNPTASSTVTVTVTTSSSTTSFSALNCKCLVAAFLVIIWLSSFMVCADTECVFLSDR